MVIHFAYDKKQVLHALRYHFISRPEIRIMLVLVNVFTILSAVLFYLHRIHPMPFLIFSLLWFGMLITIWKLLPLNVYKRSRTFQDNFSMNLNQQQVVLETEKGAMAWQWRDFSTFLESPNFFHLYFTSRAFFLVPKDAFGDLNLLQEARALLKEKLKS